jgi:hypothetical protein
MAIDQKIVDLINAEIDGQIDASDRRELEAVLATNIEARKFHAEMSLLCTTMDSVESLEPPPHLKHRIMESARPKPPKARDAGFLNGLFAAPAMRFAAAFAAGVVLTLSFVSSDDISKTAFDDVAGLVGTMTDSGDLPLNKSNISISRSDVAGTVAYHRSGQLLVIDFDLVSDRPIDIVAGFADRKIWFNGFAQLESRGTTVAAEPGRVTMRVDGKRRCALYLNDAGKKDAQIDLQFVAAGTVIHEAQLVFESTK